MAGWGQVYTGHWVKGGVGMGAFAGALGYTLFKVYQTDNSHNADAAFRDWLGGSDWRATINARRAADPLADHKDSLKMDSLCNDYSKI